jgi:CHASE2 domain-containing sensor protein
MTQELSNIVFLSLFYWGLSVLMLRIVIHERRQRLYLISVGYFAISVGVGQAIAMKWLLAASLLFMVVSMLITLWILLKQSRQCIRDLKAMHEAEKHSKPSQKEESSNGQ